MTDWQILAALMLAAGLIGTGVLLMLHRDTSGPDLPPPPPDLDLRRLGK